MKPWQLGLWPMVDLWPDDLTLTDPDEDDDLLGYSIHEGLEEWAV